MEMMKVIGVVKGYSIRRKERTLAKEDVSLR
jgi:hypothetical protein